MTTQTAVEGQEPAGAAAVADFAAALRGEVVLAGDKGYDRAREAWNALVDRRPALIAYCTGVADVISAVNFARRHGLLVAVRAGGHSFPGHSVCDGGIVIDISRMKGVRVDAARRTARAEAGLTWGELDHETQAFGLATPGGMVRITGIAGLTVGGGSQAWLLRKHGAACDNLVAVDIVTANGEFLTASQSENSDLFWGVRGGGGNFGIVTSFEYQLHPVGPEILGGAVFYAAEKAPEVLRFYREFTATAPDELTTMLAFLNANEYVAPMLPEAIHGHDLVAVAACYTGELERGEEVVRPLRAFGPPVADILGPIPYSAMQSMFDAVSPPGWYRYSKTDSLAELSDAAIDAICAIGSDVPPLSVVHLNHQAGAFGRIEADATPLSYRDAPYAFSFGVAWTDPTETEAQIAWTRASWESMRPHTTGRAYVNFIDGDEGDERVRNAYGPAYERLAALKHRYDPTNFFSLNQNIKPTT